MKLGLFLSSDPSWGGIFQYSRSVLKAFAALPPDVEKQVWALDPRWTPLAREVGLEVRVLRPGLAARSFRKAWFTLNLPWSGWRRVSPALHTVARELARDASDLWIFPGQDQWAADAPVPSLVMIHDLMHRYEGRFPEVACEFKSREKLYGSLCRFARGLVVDSQVGRTQVVESYGVNAFHVHVLPYVAWEGDFGGAADLPADLPAKFLFYPAQFWAHKNHAGLLRAFKLASGQCPDLALVLAGGEKNASMEVKATIERLGLASRVHRLGYVSDAGIRELYRRARGLVFPTFFGPTNIPPLEAFRAGRPVAVSDIYGMREQLGEAALYFDPLSEDSMAAALVRLWTDDRLRDELVARGQAHARGWNQTTFNSRFEQIVREVLAKRGA